MDIINCLHTQEMPRVWIWYNIADIAVTPCQTALFHHLFLLASSEHVTNIHNWALLGFPGTSESRFVSRSARLLSDSANDNNWVCFDGFSWINHSPLDITLLHVLGETWWNLVSLIKNHTSHTSHTMSFIQHLVVRFASWRSWVLSWSWKRLREGTWRMSEASDEGVLHLVPRHGKTGSNHQTHVVGIPKPKGGSIRYIYRYIMGDIMEYPRAVP